MDIILEKDIETIRLSNGKIFQCQIIFTFGENMEAILAESARKTMYLLKPIYQKNTDKYGYEIGAGRIVATETMIKRIKVSEIAYNEKGETILYGMTDNGQKDGAVKELFFETYEEASNAVKKINAFYETHQPNKDWLDDIRQAVSM